jgi:antitoxin VapB
VPLYIKDDAIDLLARRYQAAINAPSKTEAVRRALQSAMDEQLAQEPLPELAVAFCRKLRQKSDAAEAKPADKAFRDSLYE